MTAAPEVRPPERRLGVLGVLAAFVRRDFAEARSYRLAFVLDLLSTVFQIVLFFFLSRLFDVAGVSEVAGLRQGYFAFAVIGLIMMRIIDIALRTFAEKLRSEQVIGTFEAVLATPTRLPLVVLGSAVYNLMYGTAVGAVMLIVARLLGAPLTAGAPAAAAAVVAFLATLVTFASVGIVVAAVIVVFKQGLGFLGLITQFMALLGGVYFPVTIFPAPVQALATLFPFTWTLDVLRAALLEDAVLPGRLALLCVVAAASVPISLAILRAAVDRARRGGTLAQY